jgi:amino acid adenylation domain-containing protein
LVQQFLEASARRSPDKIALVCGSERVSYRELNTGANQLANALRASGIHRGDRVVIFLESSVQTVVAIFGALKAGALFVVLHPSTKSDKLRILLDDAAPFALVTNQAHARSTRDAIASVESLRTIVWADSRALPFSTKVSHVLWSELAGLSAEQPVCASIDADLATLIYTSGSTGQAKGVMSTHLNMVTATTSINAYVGNREDDVIIDLLPLSFDYGLYQVFLAFQVGARVVLESGFAYPAHTLNVIEREGVTGLPAVPTLVAILLKYPNLLNRELPALRYITNTAAALPVSHIQRLRELLPRVRLVSMYGLTECKRVSYLPPEELDRRPDSVGIAIPNTEVYVVGEDGKRARPGQEGELVVRGSHVTRGYWRAPELTAEKFRPGEIAGEIVLYTGDIFRMDEDGFLYFIRRKDDVIKSRGEKVSPKEVEEAACRLEGVAEAAVLGLTDAVLGQAIVLVVAPRVGADLTVAAIRAHCAQLLDDFMQPKYVDIVCELPRTPNGKVDKRRILSEFEQATTRL